MPLSRRSPSACVDARTSRARPLVLALALAWLAVAALSPARAAEPDAHPAPPSAEQLEFFEKKIRPLLVKHCYECHSRDAKSNKASLYLDTREGTRQGGDSGPAVVPGNLDESLLLDAVHYRSWEMPPRGKLPPEAIADLETWIKLGAADPREGGPVAKAVPNVIAAKDFWSYQPVKEVATPAVQDAAWPRDDVDRFILVTLEAHALAPSPDADKRTLLRRVTYDLIGLPPTPAEINAFLAEESPEALAKVVDGLLARPQFGERWGRHWLDVARYGDTTGGGRSTIFPTAWKYRNYVVKAFNSDLPFDQFVREQLAGDFVPSTSLDDRAEKLAALGFLAVGPKNLDEQDKEFLRMDVVDEQLDTIGKAFLGQTIGCARCHDHKFDAIPTADYYAMAAIFRSTKTLLPGNVSGFVQRPYPLPPEQEALVAASNEQIAEAEKRVKEAKAAVKKLQDELKDVADAKILAGIVVDDDRSTVVGSWTRSKSVAGFIGAEYLHDNNEGKGEKSISFDVELPTAGAYDVHISYTIGESRSEAAPVVIRHLDGETRQIVNQRKRPPIDGTWFPLGQFRFAAGKQTAVVLTNDGTRGHVIADAVQFVPVAEKPAVDDAVSTAAAAVRAKIEEQLASATGQAAEADKELAALKQAAPKTPPPLLGVSEEPDAGDHFICLRGNPHSLGDPAPRGVLKAALVGPAPEFPPGVSGRLPFAEWVASPTNPLTARVIVNRLWGHLFGAGLVRSVDNFGQTGELPSHPELLDRLAADFVRDRWSVKKMIRRLVLSRTYRQASTPDKAKTAADPENRWLSRQNARRLEAEAIRDAMLAVSGRLDPTPAESPYDGEPKSEVGYKVVSNRRSVYLPASRMELPEIFEVFDFADPNLVVGQRSASVLPSQSLYLLNSPFAMEQATAAAEATAALDADDSARIDDAYQRTLGRPARDGEKRVLLDFLQAAPTTTQQGQAKPAVAAWRTIYQALFESLEFRRIH